MSKDMIIQNVNDVKSVSTALAQSGYFKDASDASKAFVKVLAGHELGIPAFASMTGIHIIQGKPELGAHILASLVKSSGKYNYKILEMTDEVCSVEFFENWSGKWESCGPPSVFTVADAKRAGTQNMQKFPRNMLFARAMSNGVKWYCPDVTSGVTVYSEGEISGQAQVEQQQKTQDIQAEYSVEVMPATNVSKEQLKRLFSMIGNFAGENGLDSKQTRTLQENFKRAINSDEYLMLSIESSTEIPSSAYDYITGQGFESLCNSALALTVNQLGE